MIWRAKRFRAVPQCRLPIFGLRPKLSARAVSTRRCALGGLRRTVWPYLRRTTITEYFQPGISSAITLPSACRSIPFFSPSQKAHAEAADATRCKPRRMRKAPRTRCRKRLSGCNARSNNWQPHNRWRTWNTKCAIGSGDVQVRVDAGSANWHDLQDARDQTERTLQHFAGRKLPTAARKDHSAAGHG